MPALVERLTKRVVMAWTVMAIALQVWLLHYSWKELPWLVPMVAVGAALAVRVDRRAIAGVVVCGYLFPVIVRYVRGVPSPYYIVLWLAAIAGATFPVLWTDGWHLPRRWRWALVFSALATVVGTSIAIVREIDGLTAMVVDLERVSWGIGTPPLFTLNWMLHTGLTLVVGILWFDWLCADASHDQSSLREWAIGALVASALAMSLVAIYQAGVDITFWNDTNFSVLGRATGTTDDANVLGMVAALWLAGSVVWASQRGGWRWSVAAFASVAHAGAVWASGSRTSLVAAALGVCGLVVWVVMADRASRRTRALLAAAVFGVAVIGGIAFGVAEQKAMNPVSRLWDFFATHPSVSSLASETWNRNGYGQVATTLITEHPWAGVGVGAFHGLVSPAASRAGLLLPPDNAQNWLRHVVVEFGALGSVGWIAWFVACAAFVCRPRRDESPGAWGLRGVLFAFGFVSMVGMPGQNPVVAITFWTIVWWYASLVRAPHAAAATSVPLPAWSWAVLALGLAAFAGVSIVEARGTLRPAARAIAYGEAYRYGYGPSIAVGDLEGYQALATRGVTVVERGGPWLSVTVRRRAATRALVDVRVWSGRDSILKARLIDDTPVTGFLEVDAGLRAIVLEASATDPDAGAWQHVPDTGVLIRWGFVNDVPTSFKAGYRAR